MSHKIILAAIAALAVTSMPSAHAQDSLAAANSSVRVYVGAHNLDYHERIDTDKIKDGVLDSEKGTQPLVGGGVSWQFTSGVLKNVYAEIDARHAHGKGNYHGFLQNTQTSELIPYDFDNDRHITTEAVVKLGYAFAFNPGNGQVVPYLAYGKYRWQRDTTDSPYGYREDYRHDFIAAGVKYQAQLSPTVNLDLGASVGKTRNASVNVPEFGNNFTLGASTISSLQVGLVQQVSPRIDFRYGIDASRFSYGQSAPQNGYLEPESNTVLLNFTVGVGYRF